MLTLVPPNQDGHPSSSVLQSVSGLALTHEASIFGHVTISIGAACLYPQPDIVVGQLTALADEAMYIAKRDGRNRVHMAKLPGLAIARGPLALAAG
jgi:diguanylate cyclase (GGDEF)-like protein